MAANSLESADMNHERRVVRYRGHVQGVGFRFTAVRIAQNHAVSGYVANLPDGAVRLVAEGEPAELDRFFQAVRSALAGHINDFDVDVSQATNEFTGFDVRFS